MAGHVCLEQTHPVIIKAPLSLLKILFQNLLCYLAYTRLQKSAPQPDGWGVVSSCSSLPYCQ